MSAEQSNLTNQAHTLTHSAFIGEFVRSNTSHQRAAGEHQPNHTEQVEGESEFTVSEHERTGKTGEGRGGKGGGASPPGLVTAGGRQTRSVIDSFTNIPRRIETCTTDPLSAGNTTTRGCVAKIKWAMGGQGVQ